jgi:hypothetical protein
MKNQRLTFLSRKTTTLWLALFCAFSSIAQTSNISGVVNSYYQVIEVIPARNCMRVSNPAGLSTAFKILIVQMKGAVVSTANDATYGDVSSINNAGNYEVAYVCYVNGDSVFMVHNLLNTYTSTDKVQIVRFADYTNAVVTDSLKAQPWNNATGTGGVIALTVLDNLTLNSAISADGAGSKGGDYVDTGDICVGILTNYVFNPTAAQQNGAYKGEGIYAVASVTVNGGRGAPANGGGGGNNHNNSGGGGANLSAGGTGGGNSASAGCTSSFPGVGGKPLSSAGGTKIFLGGGGGAGHNNGGFTSSHGGNGGGIIFIDADTIISNGRTISARGALGGGGTSDGSGGGGAGGTIILNVTQYTGAASISVAGGKGGDTDNNGVNQRCYAGGGGGSGGVIYFSGAAPAGTITVAGGLSGEDTERAANCNASIPALPGTAGSTIPNYTYRRSTTFSTLCGFALPSKLAYFKAKLVGKTVQLNWRSLNPEFIDRFIVERMSGSGWQQLAVVAANDTRELYSYTDGNPSKGENLYRIKIMEKNLSTYYSPSRLILITDNAGGFSIYPNPASDKITISGNFTTAADFFLLDITGKQLLQKKIISSITDIPLPALPKGIYLIRTNEATQKLIIQ